MTKTTIAAPVSATATAVAAEAARRADGAPARRAEAAPELRPLADWALVLVGGGDTTPNW